MLRLPIAFLLLCSLTAAQSAQKNRWVDWEPFLGTWQGEGSGEPGHGEGEFTFAVELQGTVLARHSYAEYPATKDKAAYRHDDLMVIYAEDDQRTRAEYWDNEGHVIHYDVEVSDKKLVFVSDPAHVGPRYRLTYVQSGKDTLKMTFEIAPLTDRNSFQKYIEASAHRKTRT